MRFDEEWVRDECEKRAEVREREEAVGDGAALCALEPDLQKRARGAEQEERQPDGEGECREDRGDGVIEALADLWREDLLRDQQDDSGGEGDQIDMAAPGGGLATGDPVGVEIAEEQGGLKEDEACEPHRGGATKDWQKLFRGHRLHEEEQEGAEKDGDAVEQAWGWHWFCESPVMRVSGALMYSFDSRFQSAGAQEEDIGRFVTRAIEKGGLEIFAGLGGSKNA